MAVVAEGLGRSRPDIIEATAKFFRLKVVPIWIVGSVCSTLEQEKESWRPKL